MKTNLKTKTTNIRIDIRHDYDGVDYYEFLEILKNILMKFDITLEEVDENWMDDYMDFSFTSEIRDIEALRSALTEEINAWIETAEKDHSLRSFILSNVRKSERKKLHNDPLVLNMNRK